MRLFRHSTRLPFRGGRFCVRRFSSSPRWLPSRWLRDYQALEQTVESRRTSSLRRTVKDVLSDPAAFQDAEKLQEFDTYFQGYVFPVMTQFESETQLGKIGQGRKSFLTRYLWKAGHPAVHKHLTGMTLDQMKTVATGNYSSSCQVQRGPHSWSS